MSTPSFRIAVIASMDDIPEWADREEFSENSFSRNYRTCVAIMVDGKVEYHWDGGEPEDNKFGRKWYWVAPALAAAYEAGLRDAGQGVRRTLSHGHSRSLEPCDVCMTYMGAAATDGCALLGRT